jgi:hypothetical protein
MPALQDPLSRHKFARMKGNDVARLAGVWFMGGGPGRDDRGPRRLRSGWSMVREGRARTRTTLMTIQPNVVVIVKRFR